MKKLILPLLVLCSLCLFGVAIAQACPNCKENLAGDPTSDGLARGFYYSILFMLSMPFFILGGLSTYFYFLVKRAEAEKAQAAANALDVVPNA